MTDVSVSDKTRGVLWFTGARVTPMCAYALLRHPRRFSMFMNGIRELQEERQSDALGEDGDARVRRWDSDTIARLGDYRHEEERLFRMAALGLLTDAAFRSNSPFFRLTRHTTRAVHFTGPFDLLFDIPVCSEDFVVDAPRVLFSDCEDQCIIVAQLAERARARVWLVTGQRYHLFLRRMASHFKPRLSSNQEAGLEACAAWHNELTRLSREAAANTNTVKDISRMPYPRVYLSDLRAATVVPWWRDSIRFDDEFAMETIHEERIL